MDFIPYRLFSIVPPFSVVSKCALAGGLFKPPSEREGDRVSGGRSLRDFEFRITSTRRALPQSPTATAPSRMEPLAVAADLAVIPFNFTIPPSRLRVPPSRCGARRYPAKRKTGAYVPNTVCVWRSPYRFGFHIVGEKFSPFLISENYAFLAISAVSRAMTSSSLVGSIQICTRLSEAEMQVLPFLPKVFLFASSSILTPRYSRPEHAPERI